MGWFTRRREREQAQARTDALHELTTLVRATIDERNPAWHCTSCHTIMGHLSDCPDRDRPFPPDEDVEPYEPTIVAYLPLDWRDQVKQRVDDPATRALVVAMVEAWEHPDSLNPGEAYLEGIADTYSITNASLWGAAIGSTIDGERAALIKAGAAALRDAREYRAMQRRRYPRRRPARDLAS